MLVDALSLNVDQVLALKKPSQIFAPDRDVNQNLWRKLASKWHPDKASVDNKDAAGAAFSKIKDLFESAQSMLDGDSWGEGFPVVFEMEGGKKFQFICLGKEVVVGFGTQFIGQGRVLYEVPAMNGKLVEIWVAGMKRLNESGRANKDYAGTHLRHTMGITLDLKKLSNGNTLITILKDPEFLCLKHVLSKGALIPEHVTWIMTRLYNMAAMMQVLDIPNMDMSTRCIFIHPKSHSVMLMDGWQFVPRFKTEFHAAPARTLKLCSGIAGRAAAVSGDVLTLIKALGRECLGAGSEAALLGRKDVPAPLAAWLCAGAGNDAIKESISWAKVKEASFGPPKYVEFKLTEDDVYPLS